MILRLLIVFLALISHAVWACETPEDYVPIAERQPKALLFQVSGCGLPLRDIFGTYHSDSPKIQPIIEHLLPYLQQSERLWVEIVSDPSQLAKTQQYLMLPKESPALPDIIGDALYEQTKTTLAPLLNIPENVLLRFRPWAIALLAQYPPPEHDGIILDVKLQHLAARKAIGVSGLEDLASQFSIFTNMDEEMQIAFLSSTLEEFDELMPLIKQLEKYYLERDIWAIERLSREQFDDMAQKWPNLSDYLEKTLIDHRNRQMAARILSRQDHTPFIAVGALHLPGETGLLSHFEAAGLQISPLN